jgi:hypothetical protein
MVLIQQVEQEAAAAAATSSVGTVWRIITRSARGGIALIMRGVGIMLKIMCDVEMNK